MLFSANGGTAGINLNLNFLNRSAGGTIDITPDTNSTVLMSNSTTTASIGGWATANGGVNWARQERRNIVPLATYGANVYSSGTNTDVTTPICPACRRIHHQLASLQYASPALFVSGTNVLQSGAIPGNSRHVRHWSRPQRRAHRQAPR